MKESEQRRLLCALDAALEVLRTNPESLGVGDVRLKSMLTVLRGELLERMGGRGRRPDGTQQSPAR